jgi:hypothetical protein
MDMDGIEGTIRQLERTQLINKVKEQEKHIREQEDLIANILREREEDQGVIRVWRGRTQRAEEQIEDLLTIKDDFCKCFDLALRLDSQNPEQARSFTGTVSERLVRSVEAMEARFEDEVTQRIVFERQRDSFQDRAMDLEEKLEFSKKEFSASLSDNTRKWEEIVAWRERFPQMEYRAMDSCIDLKFSEFQKD